MADVNQEAAQTAALLQQVNKELLPGAGWAFGLSVQKFRLRIGLRLRIG